MVPCTVNRFREDSFLYQGGSFAYIMPQEKSIDIDSEIDFQMAELLIDSEIDEEVKKDDVVGKWLGSKRCMILPIDDEVQRNVSRIVTEHPKMISFSGRKGSSSGDAFLIATAMKYNLTIITEENKDKQNKIPNICKCYGIPTVSITELCVAEGWVF